MYSLSELNLDKSLSNKFKKQYHKNIDVYKHKKFNNYIIYVNNKYYTQYPTNQSINKTHFTQSMQFYGRVGDMYKEIGKRKQEGKYTREKELKSKIQNVTREIAKDLVHIGFKGKKSWSYK